MYGAILGDIIGSPFEFDRGSKTKKFELFSKESSFTDDSVMTAAVAEALLDAGKDASPERIRELVTASMRKWGRKYPYAGYAADFVYGCSRKIRCRTEAMEMVPPCVYPPQDGCTIRWNEPWKWQERPRR